MAPNAVVVFADVPGCDVGAAWEVGAPALAKSPPVGAAVDAGLAPKSPPPAPEVACEAPKSPPPPPEDVVAAACAACADPDESDFAAPDPKSPVDDPACWPLLLPNMLVEAGFGESAGGAPAGVVDARENMGFAGVVAVAVGVVPWLLELLPALFGNKEFPELAKRPE